MRSALLWRKKREIAHFVREIETAAYSDDGELIVWLHDGECGTDGHHSPRGSFKAVMKLELSSGQHMSVGRRCEKLFGK